MATKPSFRRTGTMRATTTTRTGTTTLTGTRTRLTPHGRRMRVRRAVRRLGASVRRVTDPVARFVRPVTSVVSTLGWVVLAVTALAWWAGLAYSWLEVLVLAILGTVALLTGVAFVLGRIRYEVELDLAHQRVSVGERAVGRLDVRNGTARAVLPSIMELPVGAGVATFPIPRLKPGDAHEEIFAVPTHRRAVIPVGPVRSVRADALGLLRREVVWTVPEELFVHPRTKPLAGSSTGFLKDLEGRVTPDLSDSDISFHALRDYVPGDDRRHVHWKSTARTGQLMVRQFEETRRSHLAVMLSTRSEDYADPDEFELAVSASGSLGLQAIREDRGLSLLVNGGTLRGDNRTRLLDDLARVETRSTRHTVVELARLASPHIAGASIVAIVVGSRVSATDLRAASARLGQDVRVMAILCQPGAAVSRHTLGDLVVLTLGELGDLPAMLRRIRD